MRPGPLTRATAAVGATAVAAAGLLTAVAGCIMPAVRCMRMSIPAALKSD